MHIFTPIMLSCYPFYIISLCYCIGNSRNDHASKTSLEKRKTSRNIEELVLQFHLPIHYFISFCLTEIKS